MTTKPIKRVIGNATLYCGDCREIVPQIPNIGACVTDPPYGTDNNTGYGRRQNRKRADKKGDDIVGDQDLSMLADLVPLLFRKVSGWLLVFYSPRNAREFHRVTGMLEWHGELVWVKAPGLGFPIQYAHEGIAIFRGADVQRPDNGVVSVLRGAVETDKRHPHQKPVDVVRYCVQFANPAKGVLLDPFMGSGTTGEVCAQLGIPFVGIEIDQTHFDYACTRIENAQGQPMLLSNHAPGSRRIRARTGGQPSIMES